MQERKLLLELLIEYRLSADELAQQLKTYSWDSEEELVTLTNKHIISVLARYLNDTFTEQEVEDWADLIEGREDIAMSETVIDAIDQLANPELAEPLDQIGAEKLITKLRTR